MAKRSRRYGKMIKELDTSRRYAAREAVEALLNNGHRAKFEESVDLAI